MIRLFRKNLFDLQIEPRNKENWILIQNQFWPVDDLDNVFFRGLSPICGNTKKSAHFLIKRFNLPIYHWRNNGNSVYGLVYLGKVWIRQRRNKGRTK